MLVLRAGAFLPPPSSGLGSILLPPPSGSSGAAGNLPPSTGASKVLLFVGEIQFSWPLKKKDCYLQLSLLQKMFKEFNHFVCINWGQDAINFILISITNQN